MNDTDRKPSKQPSHKGKSGSYDPRDRLRTSHIKMTPVARFYLQALSQFEGKSQGRLIEEWAVSRYAWKRYSGALITLTRKMKSTVRWLLLSELKAKEITFLDLLRDEENCVILCFKRFYYYYRSVIEVVQVRLAYAFLEAESRIRYFISRVKSRRKKETE